MNKKTIDRIKRNNELFWALAELIVSCEKTMELCKDTEPTIYKNSKRLRNRAQRQMALMDKLGLIDMDLDIKV